MECKLEKYCIPSKLIILVFVNLELIFNFDIASSLRSISVIVSTSLLYILVFSSLPKISLIILAKSLSSFSSKTIKSELVVKSFFSKLL